MKFYITQTRRNFRASNNAIAYTASSVINLITLVRFHHPAAQFIAR